MVRKTGGFTPSSTYSCPRKLPVEFLETLQISGNWGETADMKALTQRIDNTLDELRAVPGVLGAATSASLPGILSDSRTELKVTERSNMEDKIFADSRHVSNGYFETMRIPVLAGEDCRQSANYYSNVVVNRSFANTYLAGVQAIEHHVNLVSSQFLPSPARILGAVGDPREQGSIASQSPLSIGVSALPIQVRIFLFEHRAIPWRWRK
ncbi:MAG: hypothetical protein WA324_16280 [Bryobacteraceae bacterium]